MENYKIVNNAEYYRSPEDVTALIGYVINPLKTQPDGVFGGAVDPTFAAEAMNCVIDSYEQHDGLRMRHSVLSFDDNESATCSIAKAIAPELISYYSSQYQIVAGVHQDTDHLHIHFAMNTTAYTDGHKYRGTRKDYYDFFNHINAVLKPYKICVRLRKSNDDANTNNHTESQDTDTIYHFYDEDDET
ncbi:relaxase/mobilization nuclease domain-containing protein [Bengtsoniella intestinalis]|uniref:relaxase/mobilization nuclease domain-containing protein n=1 Tax=Bengtsoniella intestinalis TaxID=3073143 RepID=UPI00391F0218